MSRTRYSDILVYPTYYHVTNLVGLTDSDCTISFMYKHFEQITTEIVIIIIMAKVAVILHGLATTNEGDDYGLQFTALP